MNYLIGAGGCAMTVALLSSFRSLGDQSIGNPMAGNLIQVLAHGSQIKTS